jgi:hypothetical protein
MGKGKGMVAKVKAEEKLGGMERRLKLQPFDRIALILLLRFSAI